MRTVVLDTNVLLSQPEVINDFGNAVVVIPQTVLSEIDKLKTARVDPELRFKGRALSRLLFDLAETGDLGEGVELPGGGILRVVAFAEDRPMPEGLSPRNADDRILGAALRLCEDDCDVTVVTNDLNMLIKAQAHGLQVERAAIVDEGFARRFIVRPFQRYRVPLTILAMSFALFAAIVYLVAYSPLAVGRQVGGLASVPKEFLDQLSVEQQQQLSYLYKLDADPRDTEAQRNLAQLYDGLSQQNHTYLPYAVRHYEQLLELVPNDTAARTDLASAYFREGQLVKAMSEVKQVLQMEPEDVNANYNLGIFYLSQDPKDYQRAASQFARTVEFARQQQRPDAETRARDMLEKVKHDAAAAGQQLHVDGGTL